MAAEQIAIEADGLRLVVVPELGGKVVELTCLRHDRQWLAQPCPELPPAPGPDEYGPAEAWGWDELFPSVLSGAEAPAPWPGPLRDHGELWGRPWKFVDRAVDSLALEYADESLGFRFRRELTLGGGSVACAYRLSSERDDQVPFQWSMHPIFDLRPGERLELPGVAAVRASGVGHPALSEGPARLVWPTHGGIALNRVTGSDGETIMKLYAGPTVGGAAAVSGGECGLRFRTDPAFAPHFGIYLNYGGWPAGGPLHHVGIEPTNAPEDDLDAAVRAGSARVLAPRDQLHWAIEIGLGTGCRER